MSNEQKGEIIIYQAEDGTPKIDVRFENDSLWLSQAQLVELYQSSKANVSEHIKHIFEEEELSELATVRKFRTVREEGSRSVSREIEFYNLDMIISLGYRIKSRTATRFRMWATERLKEYIIKGFVLDDERLKQAGGGGYWYELLNRIRDIRSSEKLMYRQVLDLYANSIDYDANTPETVEFFKIVQNKLHFAAHGHTAAEVVYLRADSNKPFMGMTNFPGIQPTKKDVQIAKNYLSEEELKILNNLVSGYFDFAEIQAIKRKPMYMQDYINQLDGILSVTGEKILKTAGSISHKKALEKANREYQKFQLSTYSPIEQAYFENIKALQKEIVKNKVEADE